MAFIDKINFQERENHGVTVQRSPRVVRAQTRHAQVPIPVPAPPTTHLSRPAASAAPKDADDGLSRRTGVGNRAVGGSRNCYAARRAHDCALGLPIRWFLERPRLQEASRGEPYNACVNSEATVLLRPRLHRGPLAAIHRMVAKLEGTMIFRRRKIATADSPKLHYRMPRCSPPLQSNLMRNLDLSRACVEALNDIILPDMVYKKLSGATYVDAIRHRLDPRALF